MLHHPHLFDLLTFMILGEVYLSYSSSLRKFFIALLLPRSNMLHNNLFLTLSMRKAYEILGFLRPLRFYDTVQSRRQLPKSRKNLLPWYSGQMETVCSCKTLETTHYTTRRYKPHLTSTLSLVRQAFELYKCTAASYGLLILEVIC
jgi:hypothetical protein